LQRRVVDPAGKRSQDPRRPREGIPGTLLVPALLVFSFAIEGQPTEAEPIEALLTLLWLLSSVRPLLGRSLLFARRLPSRLWLACLVLVGERRVAHRFVLLFVRVGSCLLLLYRVASLILKLLDGGGNFALNPSEGATGFFDLLLGEQLTLKFLDGVLGPANEAAEVPGDARLVLVLEAVRDQSLYAQP
jgi:hypothetical protein